MLEKLARFTIRRRRAVLIAALVVFAIAGGVGAGVTEHLTAAGFEDPDFDSVEARELLAERFGTAEPNVVLLVTAPGGVDSDEAAQAGAALTRRLADEPQILEASSYWTLGQPEALRSDGGGKALVLGRIEGDEDAIKHWVEDHGHRYEGEIDGLDVLLGGSGPGTVEITERTERDFITIEAVVVPITLLVLVLVFGSVVAASLPVVMALLTVVGALLLLRLLVTVTDLSIFALNVATFFGLALAIDYGLLIISRFREELRGGADVPEAITTSVRTAGKAVIFSGLTLMLALAGLLAFPLGFLRSIAYGVAATTTWAVLAAVVVLPALLAVIGRRIDRWRLIRPRETSADPERGFWHRLATFVMRRPVPVALVVVALLLFLGLPFTGLRMGLADERVLPDSATSVQVGEALRTEFSGNEQDVLEVVAADTGGEAATRDAEIAAYAERLSRLPDVARVDALTGSYADGAQVAEPADASARFATGDSTYLTVVPEVSGTSTAGEQLARAVRAEPAPFPVLVGGTAAVYADSLDAVSGGLVPALLIIALSTFVLLFLMTGSVVIPAKAILLNVLSLTATMGAMVWIFQDGNLRGLFGDFTVTGTITFTAPVLLFCIAFGLSMDYEVFLLSRIKEEHDRTGDNVASVASGLQRSGRLITAAAAVVSIVFIGLVFSSVSYMKMLGFGLALAVLMDATLVRGTLVPAFMRLLGEVNWWSPRFLRPIYRRFAIAEGGEPETSDRAAPREPVAPRSS